mgnify:FL=1
MTREDLFELLDNKEWRLNNLYYITDKNGHQVLFNFNKEQAAFFESQHTRNIILKARQLGFTTLKCIEQLDAAIFDNDKCAMITHSLNDSNRLFREKIKYAYDRLPDFIKQANPAANDRSGELVFANGGSVSVSTSFRGGTLASLHISEFGKICAKYPQKADEIVTGAIEAVPLNGNVTIESTAEGRAGYFYEYCQSAENLKLSGKIPTELDYAFHFFSWFDNPDYEISGVELTQDTIDYFDSLGLSGLKQEKKAWYQLKALALGENIKREYPTTPAEAFEQSLEGAYYANQIKQLYAEKRICKLPDNSHLPVNTAWDLGVGDSTAIWFWREVGDEVHVIDYYEMNGEGLRHYVDVLKSKGYEYGKHYAPHDIANRDLSGDGKSRKELALELYGINFEVIPRSSIEMGIEVVRKLLPSCAFDETLSVGINHLASYRKAWNDKYGVWSDKPLHDQHSHAADAFRYLALSFEKRERKMTARKFKLG